jgi:hypothetical protein
LETSSVPVPSIGIETTSTVLFGLISVSTGSDICPVASAFCSSWAIPRWTSGLVTSSAWTAMTAGSGPPGNAAWMRS